MTSHVYMQRSAWIRSMYGLVWVWSGWVQDFYLRQLNGVNGRDTVFVLCVSVCVCVLAQRTGQSDQFKTVKATDFKFDVHVSTDSQHMIP